MIDAHAQAVLALLAAVDDPPLTVYDGRVDVSAGRPVDPPYVLLYFAASDPLQTGSLSLAHRSERHRLDIYAHCVGATARAARMVADQVRAALLDVVPVVPGRTCWPIRLEESRPPERDETTGVPVFDAVSVYRLQSVPAA